MKKQNSSKTEEEDRSSYIDGFVLPVPQSHLDEYTRVAKTVGEIWKEYGALEYFEYVGDDLALEGTRSFLDFADAKEDEVIIFGWVVFPSKEERDLANKRVPEDPRMTDLIAPLVDSSRLIFDAKRMIYGGFRPIVKLDKD